MWARYYNQRLSMGRNLFGSYGPKMAAPQNALKALTFWTVEDCRLGCWGWPRGTQEGGRRQCPVAQKSHTPAARSPTAPRRQVGIEAGRPALRVEGPILRDRQSMNLVRGRLILN